MAMEVILLEKIQNTGDIGDLVTVGGINGTVTKIRIRATTIVDFDNKEVVVPNKTFITSNVINWSLSDPISRVVVPVGIAYGSDTKRARALLLLQQGARRRTRA